MIHDPWIGSEFKFGYLLFNQKEIKFPGISIT